MRLTFSTLALVALPLAATAQDAPSPEALSDAVTAAFADLGCSLDITDEEASEMQLAAEMAEELDIPAETLLSNEDGGYYRDVGEAVGLLLEQEALVFDEARNTITLVECEPTDTDDSVEENETMPASE